MSGYEPGTVAVATVRGVKGVRVFRTGTPQSGKWIAAESDGYLSLWVDSHQIADVRPLMVLDLDAAGPEKYPNADFAKWIRIAAENDETVSSSLNLRPEFLRKVADQIEAQTKPPRIPEPGEWGVVEASCVHAKRRWQWVNVGGNWHPIGSPQDAPDDWDSLIDPTLIREGVES